MAAKYFWLKINKDFFDSKEVRKMRKLNNGDSLVLIYLKLLLHSLPYDGKLYFEGFEDDFASDMALELDEDTEHVSAVINYLMQHEIILQLSESEYEIITAHEMTGRESDSAERTRRYRQKQRLASQCDGAVTAGDEPVTQSKRREESNIDTEKESDQKSDDGLMCDVSSFESFWTGYPRKENSRQRDEAIKAYADRLQQGYTARQLIQAAQAYSRFCKKEKRAAQYISTAANFLRDDEKLKQYIPAEEKNLDKYENPFDKFLKDDDDGKLPF